jgi:hypothetical protein
MPPPPPPRAAPANVDALLDAMVDALVRIEASLQECNHMSERHGFCWASALPSAAAALRPVDC